MTDDERQAAYEAWLYHKGDLRRAASASALTPARVSRVVTYELWRRMTPTAQEATYRHPPRKPQ